MQSKTVRVDEHGGAKEAQKVDPDQVRRAVLARREALNEAITDAPDDPLLDWDEGTEKPYFTGKPAWDVYAALVPHTPPTPCTPISDAPKRCPRACRRPRPTKPPPART